MADPTNLAPAEYEGPTVRNFAAMLREAGELLTRAAAALDVVANAGRLGSVLGAAVPPAKARPTHTRRTGTTPRC